MLQHNGIAERTKNVLMGKALRIMLSMEVSDTFLADAIAIDTYIQNLTPLDVLNWKNSWDQWYKKPSRVNAMRVFGCRAKVFVPKAI